MMVNLLTLRTIRWSGGLMDKTCDFCVSDPGSYCVVCNTIQTLYLSRLNLTCPIPTWSRWCSTLAGPLEVSIAGLPELGLTGSKPTHLIQRYGLGPPCLSPNRYLVRESKEMDWWKCQYYGWFGWWNCTVKSGGVWNHPVLCLKI